MNNNIEQIIKERDYLKKISKDLYDMAYCTKCVIHLDDSFYLSPCEIHRDSKESYELFLKTNNFYDNGFVSKIKDMDPETIDKAYKAIKNRIALAEILGM